jgi:hypothetical protein
MKAAKLRKRLTDLLADDPEIAEVAECEDRDGEIYLEVTDTDGARHDLVVSESEELFDDDEDEDDDEDDDDD